MSEGADALRGLRLAVIGLIGVTAFGTLGYMGPRRPDLRRGALSNHLHRCVHGLREWCGGPGQRTTEIFTIVLIVLGVGTVLYNLGVLAEALAEGHVRQYLWNDEWTGPSRAIAVM